MTFYPARSIRVLFCVFLQFDGAESSHHKQNKCYWGGGSVGVWVGVELCTCPYPQKVPARPLRDLKPALRSRVSGSGICTCTYLYTYVEIKICFKGNFDIFIA